MRLLYPYQVEYRDGKYVVVLNPEDEAVAFYTDERKRVRPIKRRRRKIQRVIPPSRGRERERIIKKVGVSSKPKRRLAGDRWIPEAHRLYYHFRNMARYSDMKLNPIHFQSLFRYTKKIRPDWDWDKIYEYLDEKIDPSLTYDENKTLIRQGLGRSEDEIRKEVEARYYDYKEHISDREIERLYQEYLEDMKALEETQGLPETPIAEEYPEPELSYTQEDIELMDMMWR